MYAGKRIARLRTPRRSDISEERQPGEGSGVVEVENGGGMARYVGLGRPSA